MLLVTTTNVTSRNTPIVVTATDLDSASPARRVGRTFMQVSH